MRKTFVFVPLTAAALLLGSGTVTATADPATASDTTGIARKCLEDAPPFTSYAGTGSNDPSYWPKRGTYATTTTRCADINVKLNQTRDVQTCFKKGSGWTCNGWRTLHQGKWGLAATDVLNGTQFFLQFKGTAKVSGHLDY
ncbi:hypothetical protein ACFU99_23595 [Streptomyces sp. NPDC057654]|uniref:hypothetical protein n=1 Tax=Streptomyces sp. NPDC057654 TaxID=3346196 RepID=UPI00368C8F72